MIKGEAMQKEIRLAQELVVITTEEWYFEVCDKCCGFEGYLEDYPEIKVDVIIGWKDPDTWKPIYKKYKELPIGSRVKVHQDHFYSWKSLENSTNMNTNTIEVLKEK